MKVLGVFHLGPDQYRVRARQGGCDYQHEHIFVDKTDAAVFAGKVALKGVLDLNRWKELGNGDREVES